MSNPQLRLSNGRFVKKSTVKGMKRRAEVLAEVRNAKKSKVSDTPRRNNLAIGKRIVDIEQFGGNLKCIQCNNTLSLENILKEKRLGLQSIFTIKCERCNIVTKVSTGKMHSSKNHIYMDTNLSAVLGAIHSGAGHTGLNKIFACMNMPSISSDIYKKYEAEVGAAIEEAAKDSCRKAGEEEKCLVIENIHKLHDILPSDVAEEIYPNLQILRSYTDCSNAAPDSIKNNEKTNEQFDAILGDIVNIIISYDMSWSKRGNGRSYDSLNGYGTMIGFLSGKIIDYATRNRKCASCDKGHKKTDHNCRKNFEGSSKSMEADVGTYLVNNSTILKEAGLKVRVVIGDEDSSTIAAIRKENDQTIYKLCDKNHLIKNFVKDLYEISKHNKELNKKGAIQHIKKCFTYAIAQNKGNSMGLAKAIQCIPEHLFNQHENCGECCKRSKSSNEKQTIIFQNETLYVKLKDMFKKYANNAAKFSVAASSQANESVNAIIAHKLPKRVCLSRSQAADYRVASAVCSKNDREASLLKIKEKLLLSPGTHTAVYANKSYEKRKRRFIQASSKESKLRRVQLRKDRENLRKKKETFEGITYKSNHGMSMESDKKMCHVDEIRYAENANSIVYFDLETAGLKMTDQILQIAAKCNEYEFNIYITPVQEMSPNAAKVTGFSTIASNLYLNNVEVATFHLKDALIAFNQFLNSLETPLLLVAHNSGFDAPRLLKAIVNYDLQESFNIIFGFADSLRMFRKVFPDRKGPEKFQLAVLAKDILGIEENEGFHDAIFDVHILQKLIRSTIKEEDLFKYTKTYKESLLQLIESDKVKINLNKLNLLKGVISSDLLKKVAKENITDDMLTETYKSRGKDAVLRMFNEKLPNNKPKITNHKKALDKIINKIKETCNVRDEENIY